MFISKSIPGWGTFEIGDLTGNLIQIYDLRFNVIVNVTTNNYNIFLSYTPFIEFNDNIIYYFNNIQMIIYDTYDKKLLCNTTNKFRIDTNIVAWYDAKQIVTILIKYINNDTFPYVTFLTKDGLINCQLDFNNKTTIGSNVNIFLDQFTGIVIADIASQIKIWIPIFASFRN